MMIKKYRKNPVVIEAVRFTEDTKDIAFSFIEVPGKFVGWDENDIKTITIPTLEGEMVATLGDWIIKGVRGEFYPCKHDIFEITYEPVED